MEVGHFRLRAFRSMLTGLSRGVFFQDVAKAGLKFGDEGKTHSERILNFLNITNRS